ncbi:MAG TPA: sigma 54-interacting transcriptional regulator [Thermoanaerobaculia bacterium]|jgi:transcriptional regulator with AAA-type ATPase domain|nr:sigma 54-interacting transcriptional regulator [Thermoanaerobaculia bacterium]
MSPALLVVHPSLEPVPRSIPLAAARLTGQQRIGVLLEAAGLLSLLDRAGWAVLDWSLVRVTPEGRLAVPEAAPGLSERHAQEILRELLGRLFRHEGSGALAGRGPASRAARALVDRWFQSLAPLAPDEAVSQILVDAPFLWEPAFGPVRTALCGQIDESVWVAGPREFRLLSRTRSLAELRELLAGPEARALWEGDEKDELVAQAGSLADRGRTEAALALLEGLRSPAAETVRARCQLYLGQLGAVRATLRRLENEPLTAEQAVELAEIAARVLANGGDAERAQPWVRRALELADPAGGAVGARAGLVAALSAWDRGDLPEMDRWLEITRPACSEPGLPNLAWRWHHARALRAFREPGQGEEVAVQIARAIRVGRRTLSRQEAAGLWNDLGLGRAQLGDLAGAERAFLHAAHLLEQCDGPRKITLALPNLAEIRLRRGRLLGVREILERTSAENRLAGNLRGLGLDTGMRARFELVIGRPEAALTLCREALLAPGSDADALHLFAARALGWLRCPQEAAAELSLVGTFDALEPEELPAVRAHAGDREGALREAEGTLFHPLWLGALAGNPIPMSGWEALSNLEPYRAARLVFDLDLIAPGCVPSLWLRTAVATFRKMGALAAAERLEARDQGPWHALAIFFEKGDPEALAQLYEQLGPSDGAQARALAALARRERAPLVERRSVPLGDMVGESPAFLAALERIGRLAPGDLPILILGESGTGKELAARRIHRLSSRSRAPFIAVNCAAVSETLILSDLFGHTRGAFTGADRSRQGVFESANGGTVFLDEIGDLPLPVQGLLLRVLQEGEVRPLGETLPRKVNVRVLAATHRDLGAMITEKTFRQDLYYRLKGGSVSLPALRDRGEDVLLLARRFVVRGLSAEARALLLGHLWPGNIRELQNVLSLASALAGEGVIEPEHLELPQTRIVPAGSYHQQVEALRRRLITEALARHGGNHAEAARELGLSRQSISYLIRQLRLG